VPGVDVVLQLQVPPLDSDGDGVADTFPTDGSVGVIRSDGTVTFESPGNLVSWPANAGDLDGDGRDEIWLYVTGPTNALVGTWVVPGTVSPGTHDVSTVGIRINDAITTPVADRTGDGIADLMQYTLPPFGSPVPPLTTITSGTAIMAVGAPGDARSVTPVLSTPGTFVGAFAQLSFGPPTIITATRAPDGVEFRIGDGPRFTTAPAPDLSGGQGLGDIRHVFVSDAGTYMIGATGSRSGFEQYLWRVDRPCEPLVSPSTVVAPTPQAVVATPQLTG
jgi:hypothetical protein